MMNLKEHKALLFAYEQSLLELTLLKEAQDSRVERGWKITSKCNDLEFPLSRDYAEAALQHRILALESETREQALALGIKGVVVET